MKLIKYWPICLVLFVNVIVAYDPAQKFRILGIFPTESRTNSRIAHVLFGELAERGHNVTIITPFTAKLRTANYTEVILEETYKNYMSGKFIQAIFKTKSGQ